MNNGFSQNNFDRLIPHIASAEDKDWEKVIDFTQIKKEGVDISELLSRI